MATNTVTGNLICSDGTNIPLKKELAEGTQTNLTTDTAYTVTAAEVGDFAPGKTVIGGLVSCDNGVGFCYILSQGLVAAIIPWSVKGAVTDGQPALCQPYTLKAGDIVRCMNNTAADREAAVAVYTARGVSRIFVVTASSGATNELVDLQTGNSIGDGTGHLSTATRLRRRASMSSMHSGTSSVLAAQRTRLFSNRRSRSPLYRYF